MIRRSTMGERMLKFWRWIGVGAVLLAVCPGLVRAQGTSALDGTYVGASATNMGGMQTGTVSRCPTFPAPSPLTIANGLVHGKWGGGSFEGQVAPDGAVRVKADNGGIFTGRITNQTITGRYQGACNYDLSWRKK
jgi:hypothetical protein